MNSLVKKKKKQCAFFNKLSGANVCGLSKLGVPITTTSDPEVLRKLTNSVSCALDEAAAALTRMRAETKNENKYVGIKPTKLYKPKKLSNPISGPLWKLVMMVMLVLFVDC